VSNAIYGTLVNVFSLLEVEIFPFSCLLLLFLKLLLLLGTYSLHRSNDVICGVLILRKSGKYA